MAEVNLGLVQTLETLETVLFPEFHTPSLQPLLLLLLFTYFVLKTCLLLQKIVKLQATAKDTIDKTENTNQLQW